MVSFKSLLVAAASFVVAIAQSPPPAFSSVPPVAVAGNTYNITWGGGDGTPVTLTLRKGSPTNLDTISIIASRVSGSSYEWTVSSDLETASDYALQITQGVGSINYSGLFSIVGGTGTSSISYTGATTRTASSNGTTIITQGATQARTTASMGTGTAMPRNTTFSSQSLSSTPRTITTAASTSSSSSRAATTIQQQTAAPSGNVGATVGSSAAMIMGLFGAIMFLH